MNRTGDTNTPLIAQSAFLRKENTGITAHVKVLILGLSIPCMKQKPAPVIL
jgi:hypothetical protein